MLYFCVYLQKMDDIIQIAEIEFCGQKLPLTLTLNNIVNHLSVNASRGAKLVIITHLINQLQFEENEIVIMELRKIKNMIL